MWNNNPLKILIIQDCIDSINSLRQTLKADQFRVLSCNGDHGFILSIKEEPDVILLDTCLNNRKGFEILQNLKNHWRTKHIPIIIATKINTQQYWDEAYRLGALGYMIIGKHNHYLPGKISKLITCPKAIAS
ncbi:response regulator [Labilibacter sediminis]|nr:response regulator [Labilibacter sediminis]